MFVIADGPLSNPRNIDARVAAFASTQHGVFTRVQVSSLGLTKRMIQTRLADGRWEPSRLGVYRLAGSPRTFRQDLLAVCLAYSPHALASHRSAAALRKIEPFEHGILEITVPRALRPSLEGVRIHRVSAKLAPFERESVEGIPTTTVARTLIDLAADVDPEELEIAIDDALRQKLVTVARLRWELSRTARNGRGGVTLMREMLHQRSGLIAGSPLETKVARLFRAAKVDGWVQQYEIRQGEKFLARVDFAFPEARVVVEVDGYRWHSGRQQWLHDLARGNAITALGWRVLHVTSDDIDSQPDEIVRTVRALMGGWS